MIVLVTRRGRLISGVMCTLRADEWHRYQLFAGDLTDLLGQVSIRLNHELNALLTSNATTRIPFILCSIIFFKV